MIFVIDVGNTNMTMGVFCGEKLAATFRIMTKTPRTSDEYGIMITQLLKSNGIKTSDIEGAIIASVVPDVMHSLTSSIIRYLHTKPIIVGPGVKSGIKVATEDPRGIGADRIVDAVAAYVKYGGPVLVLDFGTATTYDLITEDGRFTAGITAPGIRISSEPMERDGEAAEYRDPQAEDYSGTGDHYKYAGRSDVWSDRTDGIHHPQGKGRERSCQFEGGSHRGIGTCHRRRDRQH